MLAPGEAEATGRLTGSERPGASPKRARGEAARYAGRVAETGRRHHYGMVIRRMRVPMAPPEGFEPPTPALGRRRSIH